MDNGSEIVSVEKKNNFLNTERRQFSYKHYQGVEVILGGLTKLKES